MTYTPLLHNTISKMYFAKLQHRLEEFNENSSARVMTSPLGGNVDKRWFC